MNFDKMTIKSQEAVQEAVKLVENHDFLFTVKVKRHQYLFICCIH